MAVKLNFDYSQEGFYTECLRNVVGPKVGVIAAYMSFRTGVHTTSTGDE